MACYREAVESNVAAAGGAEGLVADAHRVWRGDAVGGVGEAVGGEGADVSGAGWGGVVKGGGGAGGFDEGEVVRGAGDYRDKAAPGEIRLLLVRGVGEVAYCLSSWIMKRPDAVLPPYIKTCRSPSAGAVLSFMVL